MPRPSISDDTAELAREQAADQLDTDDPTFEKVVRALLQRIEQLERDSYDKDARLKMYRENLSEDTLDKAAKRAVQSAEVRYNAESDTDTDKFSIEEPQGQEDESPGRGTQKPPSSLR